jgi:hypothetical protein
MIWMMIHWMISWVVSELREAKICDKRTINYRGYQMYEGYTVCPKDLPSNLR